MQRPNAIQLLPIKTEVPHNSAGPADVLDAALKRLVHFLSKSTVRDKVGVNTAKGENPFSYPSDLIFIHRKIHAGEPNAYTLKLPDGPDSIDTGPLSSGSTLV